jgi:hypothetical protein
MIRVKDLKTDLEPHPRVPENRVARKTNRGLWAKIIFCHILHIEVYKHNLRAFMDGMTDIFGT